MTVTELVPALADAIAFAEGYYVAGSRAAVNNNPGNLTVDITGQGIGTDGMFIKYANPTDGFNALYKQVEMMIMGTSAFYNPSMSIAEIAKRYASTTPDEWINWANNVAARLGVSPETTLNDLLISGGAIFASGVVIALGVLLYIFLHKR